ncbi:hypothetical protein B566_EDAN012866 [Ephemera danica]|nr:hypothetical protein B566_EDAN012866 [Ephemera danica]
MIGMVGTDSDFKSLCSLLTDGLGCFNFSSFVGAAFVDWTFTSFCSFVMGSFLDGTEVIAHDLLDVVTGTIVADKVEGGALVTTGKISFLLPLISLASIFWFCCTDSLGNSMLVAGFSVSLEVVGGLSTRPELMIVSLPCATAFMMPVSLICSCTSFHGSPQGSSVTRGSTAAGCVSGTGDFGFISTGVATLLVVLVVCSLVSSLFSFLRFAGRS